MTLIAHAAVAAFAVACAGVALTTDAGEDTAKPTLREAAGDKLLIGTALMSSSLDDPKLAELVASQFNAVTAENEMKPAAVQPQKGQFRFEAGDKIADFAEQHDMKLIGHTLVWHQQSPQFLFQDGDGQPLPREEALANLKAHIDAVAGHYKGRVHGWDVVNEALGDSEPYLRDTPALRAIGDDYIIKAFEYAAAADPEAELYYNDYNIDQPYKLPKALRLVRELKAAGVKLDGIGIQGHWMLESPPIEEIEKAIQAFKAEGLKIHFTEVDVDVLPRRGGGGADLNATERNALDPYQEGLPDDVQQKLADRYRALFELFAKYPDTIGRVTFWGIDDGRSWLNNFPTRGRTNHPMLFDRDLQPKPAYDAVIEELTQSRQ